MSARTSLVRAASGCIVVLAVSGCTTDALSEETQREVRAAPAAQQPALADGVVTFDEYEAATLALVDCIEAGGFATTAGLVDPPRSDLPPKFNVSVEVGPDPSAEDEVNRLYDACAVEHQSVVSAVYEETHMGGCPGGLLAHVTRSCGPDGP